jgi:hypothetical protein
MRPGRGGTARSLACRSSPQGDFSLFSHTHILNILICVPDCGTGRRNLSRGPFAGRRNDAICGLGEEGGCDRRPGGAAGVNVRDGVARRPGGWRWRGDRRGGQRASSLCSASSSRTLRWDEKVPPRREGEALGPLLPRYDELGLIQPRLEVLVIPVVGRLVGRAAAPDCDEVGEAGVRPAAGAEGEVEGAVLGVAAGWGARGNAALAARVVRAGAREVRVRGCEGTKRGQGGQGRWTS